ncbi:MAG: hypothetical protein ABIU55_12405 [Ferruginibacter sp.]
MTSYDPFICDECKELGYCRKAKAFISESLEKDAFTARVNLEIANQLDSVLPIQTTLKANNKLAKTMQQAHDLLRHQDIESAYLLYRAITSDLYYHWEAFLGLSLCCFYTKEYEQAAYFASQIQTQNARGWPDAIDQFIYLCESRANNAHGIDTKVNALNTHLPKMELDLKYG